MNLPLHSYDLIASLVHLALAGLIGICFGFVLERAGLGDAKKLIKQFLLKDLAVFKVMFTAIVTAMFGLFFLSAFNLINLELVQMSDSYIQPQIVGGLLLGIGFALSGYCPGTSIVGLASGKLDALVCLAGLFVGSWMFAIAFDAIEPFYLSTHLEQRTLMDWLALEYGTLTLCIAVIAILGFLVAEALESRQESK
jgi:uncharacterized protein